VRNVSPSNATEKPWSSALIADGITTRYCDVGALRLAYRELGPDSHPPLLLTQRFRGTMDDWDPAFLDAVSEKRRVYLFDSAGVGLSSGETPDTIRAMADIVADFLEAMNLPLVDMLGWSMGGYITQTLAFARPDLIRKIVIAGSGPGGVPAVPPTPARVWEVAPRPINSDGDFLYLFFPETAAGRASGQSYFARLRNRVEPAIPALKPDSITAQITALTAFRSRDSLYGRLESLKPPALYANGTKDIMAHPMNSYAAAMRAPNAQLSLYPASGHAFLFQQIEAKK
jgi:pimeloyl-ACP methyl ester carboxylesterase